MMKQCLLVLVAAGAISIAAPFAAAQDSQSNDQQARPRRAKANGTMARKIRPSGPRN